MQYAREVMDLMAAYPGREFKMASLVNYVAGRTADRRLRKRVTEGVRRVLQALEASGSIDVAAAERNGAAAAYSWRTKTREAA
jgi:hypothetical protein